MDDWNTDLWQDTSQSGHQGKRSAFEEQVILPVNGPTFVISDLITITLQQLHLHF